MLSTFLSLSLVYANEAIDYAEEMHAWVCLTQRSTVKAEAEWRNGHVYRAYFTSLDDDDLLHVARLHWAVKVLISGDKLTVDSPLTLLAMKRLRFLPLWGDQFKPLFMGPMPPPFTINRPDVELRFYRSRDDLAVQGEKGQSRAEDFIDEERRKDLTNPPPPKASFQ
jgi:hypothetical protein